MDAKGFCTDVFFAEAHRFIRKHAETKKPFFASITTNAPHGPLHCPQKYMDLYSDQPPDVAAFLGMITNIDANVGATRALLHELGLDDNTLFIFTTDNGTAGGARVFNAGMRGGKGSEYDGGHRVPFIAHWPAAGWNRKHANDTLCHAVDITPTLLDVTGATKPESVAFDGISIRRLLDPSLSTADWPVDRMLVTDSQRLHDPVKWRKTAVMSGSWRLVNGEELYTIATDPGQRHDIALKHPDRVEAMRAFYNGWWAELEPTFAEIAEMHLGHPDHPVVRLTAHDWIQSSQTPWNQRSIRLATGYGKDKRGKPSVHHAHWGVNVLKAGRYSISLRRWPAEADHPITAGLPAGGNVPGASQAYRDHEGLAIPVVTAALRVDGTTIETRPVPAGASHVDFEYELTEGSRSLSPIFIDAAGNEVGAYYAIVTTR